MSTRAFLLSIVFLAPISASLEAAVLEVSVGVAAEGAGAEVKVGELVAEQVGGRSGTAAQKPTRSRILVPGRGRLEVEPGSVWRLRVEAPGFWSPRKLTTTTAEPAAVHLDLVRAGLVEGALALPRGEPSPEELSLRFQSAAGTAEGETFAEEIVQCAVEEGRFACPAPEGLQDLRLRVPEYVSHFYWSQQVRGGESLDLGQLRLARGASLVGRVEVVKGELSPQRCSVRIAPAAAGLSYGRRAREQEERLAAEAKVSERGFFSFEGIQPGSYVVTAEQKGYAPARLFPVTVLENAETELRSPLLLERPLPFEVLVEPPLDPLDRPWNLKLMQMSTIPGGLDEVAAGELSQAGSFEIASLPPGKYAVMVLDSEGSRMAWEEVFVEQGQSSLHVDLSLTWVEGVVRLGDEPLVADLTFGGAGGVQRVELQSDLEGRFSGLLPREGDWAVDLRSESPSVSRTFQKVEVKRQQGARSARVEIELPATEIVGEVVDSRGAPVPGAVVRALETGELGRASVLVDERGEFELHGTAEGTVTVWAEDAERMSDERQVELAADRPAEPLRLVLEARQTIEGQIVSASGGVPGSVVHALSFSSLDGGALLSPGEARADVNSRFRLGVPAGASEVQITAMPPGYTLTFALLSQLPDQPLVIPVHSDGGTVVLELGEEVDWSQISSPKPILFHDGMMIGGYEMRRWARINGVDNDEPSRLVVPMLPPGAYHACMMTVTTLLGPGRPVPSPGACVQGHVSPGSEWVVQVPGSRRSES